MATEYPTAIRPTLPQGTVTFLFTDIQGSTKLLAELGDDYGGVLSRHRELLRASFGRHGGREVDTQGDAFFVAFARAREAIAAAVESQRALLGFEWPHGRPLLVRMGIHSGEPVVVEGHYVGMDVHRAARIASAAHGGQVVLSATTYQLVQDDSELSVDYASLGPHRLKDLDRPEHIFQVVAEGLEREFPPLKSLRPPTNIPHYAGALVGRAVERDELRARLRRDDIRLITISGPGGSGKTRLAAAVALELRDEFSEGAFFVDLTQLRSPDLVASAIALTLGVSFEAESVPLSALIGDIGDKHMLVVLDNFEQALESATLVSELIKSCSGLKVLVTSRVLLSLSAEHEYALDPLGLPASDARAAIEQSEAVQLFLERGQQARPGFTLDDDNAATVSHICRLLDGLPLAIELAAPRLKLFSLDALLQRLDDRLRVLTGGARDAHVRHRALRTTIDWSYDLLSPDERAFFSDFAVFAGGASLDTVERVIGDDADALTLLGSLLNHSLIMQREHPNGDVRFAMLQTIRQYARELLDSTPRALVVRERHARYFLELAERITSESYGNIAVFNDLEPDHDNFRGAFTWWLALAPDNDESATYALRLATALGRFWYTHGHAPEGSRWLQRALEVAPADCAERPAAMRWLGVLLEQRRKSGEAWDLLQEALSIFKARGDRKGEADCLNSLGIVARGRRDFDVAEELLTQSVAIKRDIGDVVGMTSSLSNLGIIAVDRREFDRAQQLFEETIALDGARDDTWAVACSRGSLGIVFLERGELDAAHDIIVESLRTFRNIGDLDGVIENLEGLVGVAAGKGEHLRAVRLAGAIQSLRGRLGIPALDQDRAYLERWLEPPRHTLANDDLKRGWQEGAQMTSEQVIAFALDEPPPTI